MTDTAAPSSKKRASNPVTFQVERLTNRTTRLRIENGRFYFGDIEDKSRNNCNIQLNELMDHGVKLDLPPRTCAKGHRMEVEARVTTPDTFYHFRFEAVVEGVQAFQNSHESATLRFTTHDTDTWACVLRCYFSEQERAESLFKRMKGE